MSTVQLACPDCGGLNSLDESELANNRLIKCVHCAEPLLLAHYRERAEDPPVWHLESTVPYSDEGRNA